MPSSPARGPSSRAARRPAGGPDGVLLLDKPPGATSHDAVERLRKVPGFRKTGHAGTLDPMATGLLVVCVNEGTKIARFLMEGDKEYVATLQLGVVTDTQDATGRVLGEGDWRRVTREDLDREARAFVGEIAQVPPMFSAIKREGVRLHQLAREAREVERPPRRVRVDAITVERFAPPEVVLRIACAKGTYVRTLAADLGERLGCGATLGALRRTRSGDFSIDQALPLDALLERDGAEAAARLIDLPEALPGFRPLPLDAGGAARARHGQMPDAPADLRAGERVKVIGPDGLLVALAEGIAERSGRPRLRALRVFHGEGADALRRGDASGDASKEV